MLLDVLDDRHQDLDDVDNAVQRVEYVAPMMFNIRENKGIIGDCGAHTQRLRVLMYDHDSAYCCIIGGCGAILQGPLLF